MEVRALVSLVAALGAAACTFDGSGEKPGDLGGVTYYQDLKPIIDAKCTGCHQADGIAPFSLESYQDVADHGGEIELAVADGIMPPWPPNDECNQYLGDRSLSDEQKAVFQAWFDGGRREGDPARPGAPIQVETAQLSRVDLELELAAEYMPQTTIDRPDEYRCFVIPWPETATRYVTGFRATPGNPSVVHHVIAFLATADQVATYQALDDAEDGMGYTCFGGTGGPAREWIGAWAPGSLGQDVPAGTGLRVDPGSAVILQVHYNVLTDGVAPDRTAIQFKLDDAVDKIARVQPWASPSWLSDTGMKSPAGDADVTHSFQYDATVLTSGKPFTIYAAGLHQHMLGTHSKLSIERPGGASACLLQIDRWNFHWQGAYGLRTPATFMPGDQLKVECHWDNSPQHQPLVRGERLPPRDVYWGEGTTDEMCLGIFYITSP